MDIKKSTDHFVGGLRQWRFLCIIGALVFLFKRNNEEKTCRYQYHQLNLQLKKKKKLIDRNSLPALGSFHLSKLMLLPGESNMELEKIMKLEMTIT